MCYLWYECCYLVWHRLLLSYNNVILSQGLQPLWRDHCLMCLQCCCTQTVFFFFQSQFWTSIHAVFHYQCINIFSANLATGLILCRLCVCFLHWSVAKASSSLWTIIVWWDVVARLLRDGCSWLWRRSMWNFRWPVRLNLRLKNTKHK